MGEGRLIEQIENQDEALQLESAVRNSIYGFLVHHDPEYWPPGLSRISRHTWQGADAWAYLSVGAAVGLLVAAGIRETTTKEIADLLHGYYVDEAEQYLTSSREMGLQEPALPYLPFTTTKILAAVERYRERGIELPVEITAE